MLADQIERSRFDDAFVPMYGSDNGKTTIHLVGRNFKTLTASMQRLFKRRSSIEPVIGHTKTECRFNRNYLKSQESARMNVILVGCDYNLRRLLRHLF